MKKIHRFTILGAGNGGKALAGHAAAMGHETTLFEGLKPGEEFLRLSEEKEMLLEGDLKVRGSLHRVTTDMEEAVSQADVILVVVPAFAHEPVFGRLIPHLRDGHRIVLIPGNYGSFLLRRMMRENGVTASVSISETVSLPYACRATSYNTVMIHKAKKAVKLATYPTKLNSEIRDVLNTITDIFIPGDNVLEVSLDNFNCIMHPLPFLLNVGSIEKNPDTFRHYMDGVTPVISEKMAEMDQERLVIGRAYSVHLMSSLDQLMMYYGENRSRTILEYVNSGQSPYKGIIGHSLYSRYITEDVPYLVVPAMLLGEKGGVKSSWFELCVHLASMLHTKDYVAAGHNLENLGIAELDKNGILDYVS